MLVECALHFFLKIYFFNKWSPNSYLFWMMEGFYIQKKMGDTKKQIIFEKCHHWWGGFQDDEKVKTLLAEQHLNLSDLQRGILLFLFFVKSISRNFLDETQESPPSFFQFKKNSYKFLFVLACCSRIYNRYWFISNWTISHTNTRHFWLLHS